MGALPPQMQLEEEEEAAPGEARVARARPSGPALDIKNLSPELVSKKIMEVAMSLIQGDDEIEVDTPLMEAGITSTVAVGLLGALERGLG